MSDDNWGPDRGLPPSGDPGHSPHLPLPTYGRDYANDDAARMGLDRNTLEGAQLHFFSHLTPSRPSHKLVAWVVLFLMFGLPLLVQLSRLLRF